MTFRRPLYRMLYRVNTVIMSMCVYSINDPSVSLSCHYFRRVWYTYFFFEIRIASAIHETFKSYTLAFIYIWFKNILHYYKTTQTKHRSCLTGRLSTVTFRVVFTVNASPVENGLWYSVNIILSFYYFILITVLIFLFKYIHQIRV